MKRLLFVALLTACDPAAAPTDAGTDAPRADAGPPVVEVFAELGATSEGLALGRTMAGDSVIFVGTSDDRIVRVSPDGTVDDHATIHEPLGMAVRADGTTLVVCAKDASEAAGIFEVAGDGTVTALVPSGPGGAPFVLTNFVAIAPDGSLVFSDSNDDRLFRADADGTNVTLITDTITYPNGLAFSAEGDTLYVASWDTTTLHALPFDASTGSYGTPVPAHEGLVNIDGVVPASGGLLVLVTSGDGIVSVDPTMPSAAPTEISAPRLITLSANGVFGDSAFGTSELYVTSLSASRLYVVHTMLTAP